MCPPWHLPGLRSHLLISALAVLVSCSVSRQPLESSLTLGTLVEGQKTLGFTVRARYLDGAAQPTGARFVHDATGFSFDFLHIDSAPQTFMWVNSLPTRTIDVRVAARTARSGTPTY